MNCSIQGLRGLACFTVFISHIGSGGISERFFGQISSELELFRFILITGQYGVELFFMISGYLITDSLSRKTSASDFIISRAIRIYPVFLAAIIPIFIFGPFFNYQYFTDKSFIEIAGDFLLNVLFIPGVFPIVAALGVAWSLSFEALFYAFACFFRFTRSTLCLNILLFISLIFVYFYPRSIFFILGFLAYKIRNKSSIFPEKPQIYTPLYLILFFTSLSFYESPEVFSSHYIFSIKLSFFLTAICSGFIFFRWVLRDTKSSENFLRDGFFYKLGLISYSFYIWHTLVMFLVKRFISFFEIQYGIVSLLIFSTASFYVSFFISKISYKYIEVEFSKFLSSKFLKD